MEAFLFAPAGAVLPTAVAALFGLLIGSFLNVVIHRLPVMMQREIDNCCACEAGRAEPHQDTYNLVVPRSCCPRCAHQITALENIPLVSWLALRGRCSACRAPISARYPAVELLTGVLAGLAAWHFGTGVLGLATLGFVFLLVAMTFIDFDTRLLPDSLTFPLLWLGLLVNLHGLLAPLPDAVLGAVAGYLVLWSVNAAFKLVRGMDGMGEGDFKLLAALGAWFGWQMLPAVILLSSVVGAVVGIAVIVFKSRGRDYQIPFGPYLAGAGLLALFYGPPLLQLTVGMTR